MGELEFPREPKVPDLTDDQIRTITNLVFIEVNSQKSDLIFIFGYGPGHTEAHWEKVAELYKQGLADQILVNGLLDPHVPEPRVPVSHLIRDFLVKFGVPSGNILVQDKSRNTLEDVIFGKALLDSKKIIPSSILFISKAHHSGRCYLTLKKYFPETQLFPYTFDAMYNGIKVSRTDWWKYPVARERVYGEYLRIKKYSERGDISTPSYSPPYQGGERERRCKQ